MKRLIVPVVLAAAMLTWGGRAVAQSPAPAPGAPHMAEMCRQMMEQHGMGGGMMGGGMMGGGMMGGGPMMGGDPKQQADMMAMRGEMMKAMGEIMLKYSQRLSPTK